MLMALLLPDPADPDCPAAFKEGARTALRNFPAAGRGWPAKMKSDEGLRGLLLKFIGDFANWDVAADRDYLAAARALVRAAHGPEPPLVVDPFAGGGSIPLEALRIGCDAFASDLNPVACLILKTMLEDIPRHGPGLADELREAGKAIKEAAEKELAEFYPNDPDGGKPIAYIWARTVRCESVGCGAEIPLARSFWLSKKANRRRALRYEVTRKRGAVPEVEFEVFSPKSEKGVQPGTVSRAKAACPACNMVLPPDRVRAQLAAQRGGADVVFDGKGNRTGGARLLAVVTLHDDKTGRQYRVAADNDYRAVWKAQKRLAKVAAQKLPNGLSPVPDEPLPPIGTLGFRVQRYGMLQWGDLFTARQRLALATLAEATRAGFAAEGGSPAAATELLALALGKTTDLSNAGTPWKPDAECPVHLFSSQKIPPLWDWAEAVVTSNASGSFTSAVDRSAATLRDAMAYGYDAGQVQLADARAKTLPSASAACVFTDPPYYDAIPYSDLSDFFYAWLVRVLPGHVLLRDPYQPRNRLTPKDLEIVQDEQRAVDGRPKDKQFFEKAMSRAFGEARRVMSPAGIGSVVFAHKTTEGWEALLAGLVGGGLSIQASWPGSCPVKWWKKDRVLP